MHLQEYYIGNVVTRYSLLYSKICQPISHEEFKAAMLRSLDLLSEHQLERWLVDFTSSNITLEDQRWAVETFGLLISDSSVKSIAMVRRDDMFLEMAAENMRDKIYDIYGHVQDLEHFESLSDALHWLCPGVTPELVVSANPC
ncbi:hypothetical protein [Pontibacter populi]|uniref:STAS/SEC14 domain-containing protein n=1 Tax=Pontibacter populi TaxID=890055 RepID=A0ABV1RQX9_9BACT